MHPQYHQAWQNLEPARPTMERATRQNTAIREAIEAAGRPLSPAEVLDEARRHVAALGLATVYRNLKALVDAGEIQVVTLPGEAARYEVARRGHHHHFRCDICQRVFDVHQCPGDLTGLAPPGFSVVRHEITLYGRCSDCQPATKRRARKPEAAHGHSH
jgi:Fur family transcriptional regulator, ferric uptake regulator